MEGAIGKDHRLNVGENEHWSRPCFFSLHRLDETFVVPEVIFLFAISALGVPTGVVFLGLVPGKAHGACVQGVASTIGPMFL